MNKKTRTITEITYSRADIIGLIKDDAQSSLKGHPDAQRGSVAFDCEDAFEGATITIIQEGKA